MNKDFLKKVFVLFFALIINQLQAQETRRIEFPANGNESSNLVMSLGHEGLLMMSKIKKDEIMVNKLDTNLASAWNKVIDLEQNLTFIDHTSDNRQVYILMGREGGTSFQVLKIVTSIGLIQKFNIETIAKFELSLFKVFDNTVYFGGTVKDEPVILTVALDNPQPRIIAGNFKSSASIQSIDYDGITQQLLVSYSYKNGKHNELMLRKYSDLGKIEEQISIVPNDEYSLLTGKIFRGSNGVDFIVGNYGFRGANSNSTPVSQGIYVSKIENGQSDFLKYYSFTAFKNFFNFMTEKQQERIEKQINRKKQKGKELYLNYRVLVHDVKEVNDNILLFADVFTPEFRTNNPYNGSAFSPFGYRNLYSLYSNPMLFRYWGMNSWAWNPNNYGYNRYNNQVFDGFRYTHAIITELDKSGNMLWDNSISYNNFKSFDLKQKLVVQRVHDDIYKLAYTNLGKLNVQIIEQDKVLFAPRTVAITTENNEEKIKDTAYDNADYWYDNHFLVYGEQRVSGDKNRRVFFINKVSY